MGLVAEFAESFLSRFVSSQDQNNLLNGVLGLINHSEIGGLPGLVEKFKSAGLGHLIDGWVAQGPNPPISSGQLQRVFTADQLRGFAQKLGINPDEASNYLAEVLPKVVDHITPSGTVPPAGIATSVAVASLQSRLFGGR